MRVGDQVEVINGLERGSIGTLVKIKRPLEMKHETYTVKFTDFELPQPYFKWELKVVECKREKDSQK